MQFDRTSPTTKIRRSMEIDVSQDQLNDWMDGRCSLQEAAPHLTGAERIFIKTGMSKEEWDDFWKGDNLK